MYLYTKTVVFPSNYALTLPQLQLHSWDDYHHPHASVPSSIPPIGSAPLWGKR